MITTELFYNRFQINYYDYKVESFKYLLENYASLKLNEKIIEYSDSDYLTAIKSDIRQTLFHAIETVFEIFLALCPDENGNETQNIIEKITSSKLPYAKISKFGKSIDSLSFLDSKVTLSDKSKSILGEHIFYPGIRKKEFQKKIKISVKAIKYGLHVLAKEFSDRREYNSYKHGLRIIPAFKNFSIFDPENKDRQLNWNLDNTMSFYSYNSKNLEDNYHTKSFDSNRDLKIITFCSFLLWNMIKIRDHIINKSKEKKGFQAFLFEKKAIDDMIKSDVKIQDLKFTIKQINN